MADPTDLRCDNCLTPHATLPNNPQCLILILVAQLVQGDCLTVEEGLALIPTVSADALWDDLGAVLDKLEAGAYALEADA